MLLPIEELTNLPVTSLQLENIIAEISEPIVDPRNLTIPAFYVNNQKTKQQDLVLFSSDIREINDLLGCIVNDESVLVPLDDLVRLKQIINFNFQLLGLKVVDERGKNHGRVTSYNVDPKSCYIEQIFVKQSMFKSLSQAGYLIHRQQVISVTNQQLVIKSATEKGQSTRAHNEFTNPFRNSRQPESSRSSSNAN